MSYATGTTHYNLPQTVGTDKRDWFDTNQAFFDVDKALFAAKEGMENNSQEITDLKGRTETAESDIANLKTDVGNNKTKISALQELTTGMQNTISDNKQDTYDMLCSVKESSATAAYEHFIGEYFIYNDTLYVAIEKINVGDTIVPNTNCVTLSLASHSGVTILKSKTMNIIPYSTTWGEVLAFIKTMYSATDIKENFNLNSLSRLKLILENPGVANINYEYTSSGNFMSVISHLDTDPVENVNFRSFIISDEIVRWQRVIITETGGVRFYDSTDGYVTDNVNYKNFILTFALT